MTSDTATLRVLSHAITEQYVYQCLIAMKAEYPEGRHWTNADYYEWKGYSPENGVIWGGGYGCAGFAFLMSDAAFGDLPSRYIDVDFSQVRVGDVLRVNNDSHSVIVLEKYSGYIVIAEGNYNSSIHWGRTMSASEVNNSTYIITRYPEGS